MNYNKLYVQTKNGCVPAEVHFGTMPLVDFRFDGFNNCHAEGTIRFGEKKIKATGHIYGDKLVLLSEKLVPITPPFFFYRDPYYNYRVTHATCSECGEVHYVDETGQMRVNGRYVTECINCAFKKRGVKLW